MIHEETAGGGCRAASFVRAFPVGVFPVWGALAWRDASGDSTVSGMGRSTAFHPDQTQPSLGIFFFLPTVTKFIGVASEVGFIPFFSPAPSSPTRD